MVEVGSGAKADLQKAWKGLVAAVVAEAGGQLPESLKPGGASAAWTTRATTSNPIVLRKGSSVGPAPRRRRSLAELKQRVVDHSHPGAQACLTAEAIRTLDRQGFVVIDEVSREERGVLSLCMLLLR